MNSFRTLLDDVDNASLRARKPSVSFSIRRRISATARSLMGLPFGCRKDFQMEVPIGVVSDFGLRFWEVGSLTVHGMIKAVQLLPNAGYLSLISQNTL